VATILFDHSLQSTGISSSAATSPAFKNLSDRRSISLLVEGKHI
jgi:hypothetical protein